MRPRLDSSNPLRSSAATPRAGAKPSAQPAPAIAADEARFSKEAIVRDAMASAQGPVGRAVTYWRAQSHAGGWRGVAGKVMGGLLTFSGLPQVERAAGELGARVGVGDSKRNIAKSAGALLFDSGLVLLNALGAGKVLTGAARGVEAAAPTVLRHYTSAEAAQKILDSGVIFASKAGSSGLDKVYLLAERGHKGMSWLRRLNIGRTGAQTARAVEIDLSKLPPSLAASFRVEATRGPLGLEHFVTHAGQLDLAALRGAVKVVDTEVLKPSWEEWLKAGGRLSGFGLLVHDANAAGGSLAQ